LQAVLAWVVSAIREILRHHPNDVIVLVGHDSVNRVILLHALDSSLSLYWRLKQDPCAINEIDVAADTATVRTVNDSWHLDGI
jgi:phosphoserine phosphatase